MRKRNLLLLLVAAALVVLGVMAFSGDDEDYRDEDLAGLPGLLRFDITGDGDHTEDFVRYPQTPPAGGPHHPRWQNCGFYTEPVRNENAVHSLEHGAVWITYRPGLPPDQVEVIREAGRDQPFVLASPYPGLPTDVVLSAWGYQLPLNSADKAVMDRFIQVFADSVHAPEPDASCRAGVGRPQESSTPPEASAQRTITVRVADGEVTPPADRVSVPAGTRVHLVVDSDAPDTAHVHGYDIAFEVGADAPGTANFTADITGVFHVELHDADQQLFELAVS